jgi:hypothetical protein
LYFSLSKKIEWKAVANGDSPGGSSLELSHIAREHGRVLQKLGQVPTPKRRLKQTCRDIIKEKVRFVVGENAPEGDVGKIQCVFLYPNLVSEQSGRACSKLNKRIPNTAAIRAIRSNFALLAAVLRRSTPMARTRDKFQCPL